MQTNIARGIAVSTQDQAWIAENLMRGADPQMLANALIHDGRSEMAVRREIMTALNHPYLIGARKAEQLAARRLAKANWALDTLAKLDRMRGPTQPLARIPAPSSEEFFNNYYYTNRPVVLCGALDKWPALQLWNPDYFIQRVGDKTVEVQVSRESNPEFEVQAERHTQSVRMRDYVEKIRHVRTNDYYMTARNGSSNRNALAPLWDDMDQLPEYLAPTDPASGFFWFGPAGTFTPLHHDLTNNFMAQVIGRKRVMIASMVHQPRIYNHLHVFSKVNLSDIDYAKFPQMRDVRVEECILEPGQVLFLPIGCWHQVEGLDLSATMTFTNFKADNDFHSFYHANGEL